MLASEQLDLVAVATESGTHAEIGLDCIHAGCHVIIEKPIALSIADADRLISAAEEKCLVLCACHQNRFNKSIQRSVKRGTWSIRSFASWRSSCALE